VSDIDPQAALDAELTRTLDGGVLRLTINRADSSNAIPYYVRDGLIDAFRSAHADLAVRVVVLTGAGERHFCTGSDLRIRPKPAPKPEGAPDLTVGTATHMMRTGFQTLMESMQECQKPVIVALNGTAAGGGAMLALAGDLLIASENAKFVDVFASRGLIPDGGYLYLLPRLVGMHKAKEIVFFGDTLSAADALELGIVNKVVAPDRLEAETGAWAERLAAKPTKVLGWAKKLMHDATELPRTGVLEEEAVFIEMNQHTEDAKERMAAMMEKRDPEWKGW
jgi:2-(1,2-epoxy-1,2-dihydrophenyl)acetyl-CoA isomerase